MPVLSDLFAKIVLTCLSNVFNDLCRVVKAVESRHEVDALRALLQLLDQFQRDADAFARAIRTSGSHALLDLRRDVDAGHFLMQEGCVSVRCERQHAHQHRDG